MVAVSLVPVRRVLGVSESVSQGVTGSWFLVGDALLGSLIFLFLSIPQELGAKLRDDGPDVSQASAHTSLPGAPVRPGALPRC